MKNSKTVFDLFFWYFAISAENATWAAWQTLKSSVFNIFDILTGGKNGGGGVEENFFT